MSFSSFKYRMRELTPALKGIGRGKVVKTNKRNFMVIEDGGAQFLISYNSLVAMKKAGENTVYANDAYMNEKTDKKGRSLGWRWCSVTTRTHAYDFGGYNPEVVDSEVFETTVKTVFPELVNLFNTNGRFSGAWGA